MESNRLRDPAREVYRCTIERLPNIINFQLQHFALEFLSLFLFFIGQPIIKETTGGQTSVLHHINASRQCIPPFFTMTFVLTALANLNTFNTCNVHNFLSFWCKVCCSHAVHPAAQKIAFVYYGLDKVPGRSIKPSLFS